MKTRTAVKTSADVLTVLATHSQAYRLRYGVQRIGLFGSWVRNEQNAQSDVDILVEFDTPTFDRYFDLKFELEAELGHPVDLVLQQTLKQYLRPLIEREVVYAA